MSNAPLRGIYENLKNIKCRKAILKEQNTIVFSPLPFYILRYSFNITFPCFANSDFQFFYSATGWAFIKHTLTRTHLSRYNRNSIEYFRILPLDILQIFFYSATGWAFKKQHRERKADVYAPLRGIYENPKNIKTQKGNTQRTKYNCFFPVAFYILRYSFNILLFSRRLSAQKKQHRERQQQKTMSTRLFEAFTNIWRISKRRKAIRS